MSTSPAPAPAPGGARQKALTLAAVAVAAALGYGGYEWFSGRHQESTDNAYVQGNVVQITPQIGGTVTAILADDTDFVKAGQPLVRLDAADAKMALSLAEANLAQAVRQVRMLYASNTTLEAQISVREGDVVRAQNDISRLSEDLARRQSISGVGAVSAEEIAHLQSQLRQAQSALATAKASVLAARDQLQSAQTMTDNTQVPSHPSVQAAAAKVREAYLALHRATLPAPVDGYVAKRSVQLGQRVAAGSPLMSVVALNALWVDANFKEAQLRNIRIGQPVTLTADVYGKKVDYKGTVVGLGAGTGAAFSLLPAQNATGNWIKVVQRVPVRIALDPAQVSAHPLRVGLSMEATVDVTAQDGKSLADAPQAASAVQTDVYELLDGQATAEIQRVIAANMGSPAPKAVAADGKHS
jgi:membrane fusion protein (multidrug efflux system)